MLQAALLWYNKFQQELEKEGFEFNPYDPCLGNRTKNGSQHMIRFHVDDVISTDKISTSLVECECVKAKIGKALHADGSPRVWKKFPPARGQKGFLS